MPINRLTLIAEKYGILIVVVAALTAAAFLNAQIASEREESLSFSSPPQETALRADSGPERKVPRIAAPEFVKGIYLSAATVGSGRLDELTALVERTELNSMVIDLKNHKGDIAFSPRRAALQPFAEKKAQLGNLVELTDKLHKKGVYLIARIFVFQDPAYAEKKPELALKRKSGGLWRDRKGLLWLDPSAAEVWKYNALIAREAHESGFDEIQFDYIRFPSDGNVSVISYPFYDGKKNKSEVITDFFVYMDKELRKKRGIPISVDLFGLTMVIRDFDLNIGQKLAAAAPHFDFISPMVYPSHYPPGFLGYKNPAEHPYEVVLDSVTKGRDLLERMGSSEASDARQTKLAAIRPWIQDFDLGAKYTAAMVRKQMDAAVKGGASGWLLWNARNVYTEEALSVER